MNSFSGSGLTKIDLGTRENVPIFDFLSREVVRERSSSGIRAVRESGAHFGKEFLAATAHRLNHYWSNSSLLYFSRCQKMKTIANHAAVCILIPPWQHEPQANLLVRPVGNAQPY
jgi:hypothetical protein